jgi:putative nucleotidyltransferase with HDIG domain
LIDLNSLVENAHELTPLPQSMVRLAALVGSKQDNVSEVADVVAFDPALTFKLIRTANSAVSGQSEPVTNVRDAVSRLGTAQVFALSVATSVRPHMQSNIPEYGFSTGDFWRHSVAAAVVTEVIQPYINAPVPPEAFTAALLHDIGKLIMAHFLSIEVLELLNQARVSGGLTVLESETRVLQVHHGELGGIIAQHWKFPERIVRGIIHHHTPELGRDVICDLVYVANLGAKKVEAKLRGKTLELMPSTEVRDRVGLKAEAFERLCDEATERFEQVRSRYNVK